MAGTVSAAAAPVDVINPVCTNPNALSVPDVCKQNLSKNKPADNPIFGPKGILTTVINILALTVGAISVFVIIIGGVKMIVSGGDSNQVASARRTVLYAVISLLIAASAEVVVRFLINSVPG